MCVCESDGSFRFICLAQFHIQCLDGLHRPVTSRAPNPAQALTKKVREKKRAQSSVSTHAEMEKTSRHGGAVERRQQEVARGHVVDRERCRYLTVKEKVDIHRPLTTCRSNKRKLFNNRPRSPVVLPL